jgi:hypothetical protein
MTAMQHGSRRVGIICSRQEQICTLINLLVQALGPCHASANLTSLHILQLITAGAQGQYYRNHAGAKAPRNGWTGVHFIPDRLETRA